MSSRLTRPDGERVDGARRSVKTNIQKFSPHPRRRDNEHSLRIIKSNRLPVGSYRQRGPGGPYRVLTHSDEVIKLDYFGRDKDEKPTRNVERVRRLLARAVDMEVRPLTGIVSRGKSKLPHFL
jgi:hypothetical protein